MASLIRAAKKTKLQLTACQLVLLVEQLSNMKGGEGGCGFKLSQTNSQTFKITEDNNKLT